MIHEFVLRARTALVLAVSGWFLWYTLPPLFFVGLLLALLIYLLLVEWPRFNLWWLTPLYPVVPFLALIDLYLSDAYLWAWAVIVVAAYDTGGYVVGKFFGTWPIVPRISSGKTVQGLVGGVFFAGLISFLSVYFLQKSLYFGILSPCIAGCAVGIIAFFGDLFESYLKRNAALKDSGYILPGHGGVLDRIDGLLFATCMIDIFLLFFR